MTEEEKEALVAAAAGAYRESRATGEIVWSPAFFDLDESGRREAYEESLRERRLEASASSDGRTGTARAVLARIRAAKL